MKRNNKLKKDRILLINNRTIYINNGEYILKSCHNGCCWQTLKRLKRKRYPVGRPALVEFLRWITFRPKEYYYDWE